MHKYDGGWLLFSVLQELLGKCKQITANMANVKPLLSPQN